MQDVQEKILIIKSHLVDNEQAYCCIYPYVKTCNSLRDDNIPEIITIHCQHIQLMSIRSIAIF